METPAPQESPDKAKYPDILFFPQDTVWDLRQRIGQATGLAPYRQHLRVGESVLGYQLRLDTPVHFPPPVLPDEEPRTDRVGHFPVDLQLAGNQEEIRVTTEEDRTLGSIFSVSAFASVSEADPETEAEIAVYDLDPWLHDLPADEYQLRTVYYGFIVKYWPLLTYPVFAALVSGGKGKKENFGEEFPYLTQIQTAVGRQDAFLREGYVLLNAPKHPTKLVVRRAVVGMSGDVLLNLEGLFNNLSTLPEMPILVYYNDRKFTKLYRMPERFTEQLYDQLEPQIAAAVRTEGKEARVAALLVMGGLSVVVVFGNTGYQVHVTKADEQSINLEELQGEVGMLVNPLLRQVNALGRLIFVGGARLAEISDHSPVDQLEVTLLWSAVVGTAQFGRLPDLLRADAELGLVRVGRERKSSLADKVEAFYLKGANYPPFHLDTANQYEYLSSTARGEYLAQRGGLYMEVQHRMTDVAVTCRGIGEETLEYWHGYVAQLLERLTLETKVPLARANLKQLKQRDPDLYAPKTKNQVVFSRVCQKSHQPVAYTEEELAKLPSARNAVKYWNFTTGQPMWYMCPNTRYPHLGFITGRHPLGYCYPCCKKTPVTPEELYYKSCLEEHSFTEDTTTAHERYIYNYGKELKEGRLGRLPGDLGRYLQYVTMMEEPPQRRRGRPVATAQERRGYYLLGVPQQVSGADHFGLLAALASAMGVEPEELLGRLGPAWSVRLNSRALLESSEAELESLADALVLAVPAQGFQVVEILYSSSSSSSLSDGERGEGKGEQYHLRRTGDPARPALVLFVRSSSSLQTETRKKEWYPVVEVDELAFFREQSVLRRNFAPETELARLLAKLDATEERPYEVLGVVGDAAIYAAVVRLSSSSSPISPLRQSRKREGRSEGGLTVIPADNRLTGAPARAYPKQAQITATARQVQTLLGKDVLAALVFQGKVIGVRASGGHVWHRPLPRAEGERFWGVPVEELPYSPDEIYASSLRPLPPPLSPPAKPEERGRGDGGRKKDNKSRAVHDQYYAAMRRVLEHLDKERNVGFRRNLEKVVHARAPADFLASLSPGDRQKVEHVLGLGLPAASALYQLQQTVYEADRRGLEALCSEEAPQTRARLRDILRQLGLKLPRGMEDIMVSEFRDPIKQQYLRQGYYPTPSAPWESLYIHG